jgi:hypothetical protein
MIDFRYFIIESVVYRGVSGKFDGNYSKSQPIVWVSTSKEHAKIYTSGDGELISFNINDRKIVSLDLGFRSVETQVKFDEVASRFKQRLMELFKKNKISKNDAMDILDKLEKISFNGHKQVWEWVHIPKFLELIKDSGFNVIRQNEGIKAHTGDTITYGVIDQRLLEMKS